MLYLTIALLYKSNAFLSMSKQHRRSTFLCYAQPLHYLQHFAAALLHYALPMRSISARYGAIAFQRYTSPGLFPT
jgi:hypothetical protein